jgi:hypothetical protein
VKRAAQRDEENDVERNRLSLPSKDPSFVNVSTEHAWIRDTFRVSVDRQHTNAVKSYTKGDVPAARLSHQSDEAGDRRHGRHGYLQ